MKLALAGLLFVLFISCSEEKKHDSNHEKSLMTSKHHSGENSEKKMTYLNDVVEGYMQVKDALVASNEKKAASAAETMLEAFKNFPMNKLNHDEHKTYMDIYENSKEQLEHIAKSNLAHQREHFVSLSKDTYDLVKLLGTETTLYKEYCSMYKKKGGMWLSKSNQIRNPYYGNKMLKCGEVQEEI